MSVCSNASSIVSYDGKEMELSDALDECFRALQTRLNDMQCAVRSMAMDDQKLDEIEDFKDLVAYEDSIQDNIDGIVMLMKELSSVTKQVRGKAPADAKAWYAQHLAQRKAEKQRIKDEAKAQKLAESVAGTTISEEKG